MLFRSFGEMGTPQREGLMTYKQFIAELEDDILPAEAERRYQVYPFVHTFIQDLFLTATLSRSEICADL